MSSYGLGLKKINDDLALKAEKIKVIGIQQATKNLNLTKSLGITYTNVEQKMILVHVSASLALGNSFLIASINSIERFKGNQTTNLAGIRAEIFFPVLPGQTFMVDSNNASSFSDLFWTEINGV